MKLLIDIPVNGLWCSGPGGATTNNWSPVKSVKGLLRVIQLVVALWMKTMGKSPFTGDKKTRSLYPFNKINIANDDDCIQYRFKKCSGQKLCN